MKLTRPSHSDFRILKSHAQRIYAEEMHRYGEFSSLKNSLEKAQSAIQLLLPNELDTENHFFYQLENEKINKIVGYIWFSIIPQETHDNISFLTFIFINEKDRRKGYAGNAIRLLEEESKKLGAKIIKFHVFKKNLGAVSLYTSLGYTIISESGFNEAKDKTNTRLEMLKYI